MRHTRYVERVSAGRNTVFDELDNTLASTLPPPHFHPMQRQACQVRRHQGSEVVGTGEELTMKSSDDDTKGILLAAGGHEREE